MSMATSSTELKTNIVGVYTSPPRKITEPRLLYKISFSEIQASNNSNFKHHEIMQKRMHIILCYQNRSNDDSGWHVGGWIKASLGNALSEHPILAGRLRRSNDGNFEIVSNDCGVRCVEAKVEMSLKDFLQSKGTKNEVAGNLIYWEDVDEHNVQFSPLFCIQVTNFNCGGYSIGISWHLLLADTSLVAKFLSRWAEIHKRIAYDGETPKISLFNAKNMRQIGYSIPTCGTRRVSNTSAKNSKTMLFDVLTYENVTSRNEMCKFFVLLCLEEVENKFGNKISFTFTLLTKDSNGDVTVTISSKLALSGSSMNVKYEFKTLDLDELGLHEIAFLDGNGPIDISHWIPYDIIEATVIVVISAPGENKFGTKVYVTLPKA